MFAREQMTAIPGLLFVFKNNIMKTEWKQLYFQLLIEINQCKTTNLDEKEAMTCCYGVSMDYWYLLKKKFKARTIHKESEEIEFFKKVKPRFTSHIEYYLLINQVLLFITEKREEKLAYLEKETKRLERFKVKYTEFITYYESRFCDHDSQYFLQRNNLLVKWPLGQIYDDKDCRSSHDCLVRGLLANQMYYYYAQGKLDELK